MDLEQKGRELALAFVNLDDLVFARELSSSGMGIVANAGRSLVGTAVIGGGMATRAAVFGAQVATKSAMAVTAAAKGIVPGADAAERMAYELDQRVGSSGETASFVASRGVGIGKTDGRVPTDPILNQEWLAKRIAPGETWNTVLADSAVNLTKLAALPLTLGTETIGNAVSSALGQQLTRSMWDAVSSFVDSTAREAGDAGTAEHSEKRAMLVAMGLTPVWLAMQDALTLTEGASRAALGDGRTLHSALTTMIDRVEGQKGANPADHTPVRLLSALENNHAGDAAHLMSIGIAIAEDSAQLAKLAALYSEVLGKLSMSSMQSAMTGALDVDKTESWVRADESSRASTGEGTRDLCPPSVEKLEALVAGDSGLFSPSTIDLARDTVFAYSSRAVGREQALERIERLFGVAAGERLADDCSLRTEIIDAGSERDRRIALLVAELQGESRERLMTARAHAAERLKTLTMKTRERMVHQLVPQRLGERAAILQRFVAMADTANALDGASANDANRRMTFERLDNWFRN